MGSNDHHDGEDFNLEIDSAVDSFFNPYEENAPKMEESMDGPASEPDMGADIGPDIVSEEEKTVLEKQQVDDTGHHAEGSPDLASGPTELFNSLTESILTIDWEVSDANVRKARDILKKIQAEFPALQESRPRKVIDGMLDTLDSIAASPQRVPATATAQLEKAMPILRGVATGTQIESGYDELIDDVIAGLEACRTGAGSVDGEGADSEGLTPDEIYSEAPVLPDVDMEAVDSGVGEAFGALHPEAVPAGISLAVRHHSEVVTQLASRSRNIADLYTEVQGAEKVREVLDKICSLLELQTRALQDVFSLNWAMAIFPIGKVNNLSDFLGFQLKAMGVCLRHTRVLENAFKKQRRSKRLWQSVYLLRIAMERQMDALARAIDGDVAIPTRADDTAETAPLAKTIRKHLVAMEECLERASFIAGCEAGCDHDKVVEAGRTLREKIAGQVDILRRALG